MSSEKKKIKRINNVLAKRVTFCKRRKGLLKKAKELSILCDADVALIIFSSTAKVFHYCNSSMKEIIERYRLHTKNHDKLLEEERPSQQLVIEDAKYAKLCQKVSDLTLQLKELSGEELHHLSIEVLHELEKSLEDGMSRVLLKKDEVIMDEIIQLQEKEMKLTEENIRLRQEMAKRCTARKQIYTLTERVA
uniref:MADS-box transcription factor 22-like n=1 Tax=Erigeron canadensis TaxID=72917 RepID=UPI001CB983A3